MRFCTVKFVANSKRVLQAMVGGINFGVTLLLSIWLLDRIGRRPLLEWAYTAMSIMYIILALSAFGGFTKHSQYRVIGLLTVIGIVVAYAVGPGPVTWVMPVEIFPLTVRTQMLSICVCGMLCVQFLWERLICRVLQITSQEMRGGSSQF